MRFGVVFLVEYKTKLFIDGVCFVAIVCHRSYV